MTHTPIVVHSQTKSTHQELCAKPKVVPSRNQIMNFPVIVDGLILSTYPELDIAIPSFDYPMYILYCNSIDIKHRVVKRKVSLSSQEHWATPNVVHSQTSSTHQEHWATPNVVPLKYIHSEPAYIKLQKN